MSDFNKELVAENLRALMARKLISSEQLSTETGLTRYQIDNILYCRALKLENLKRIAEALHIKIEQLLSTDEAKKMEIHFNPKTYSQIMLSIDRILSLYKLQTNQFIIEMIAGLIYQNFNEINDLDEVVKGMILLLHHTNPDIKKIDN